MYPFCFGRIIGRTFLKPPADIVAFAPCKAQIML